MFVMHIAAVTQNADAPKTTDWLSAWGTVGGAVATAAAVVVALTLAIKGSRDSEKQRKKDHDVDLLLRAVDARTQFKNTRSDGDRHHAMAYLSALPDDIGVLMRFELGMPELAGDHPNRRRKFEYLKGDMVWRPDAMDGYLVAREIAADLKRLSAGDKRERISGRYWWEN